MAESIFIRSQRSRRRVVITGLGLVTPLGLNVQENWKSLVSGRSGVSEITAFDPTDFSVRCAGEVKGFNPDEVLSKKDQKKVDRFVMLCLGATIQAVEDSGLDLEKDELLRARSGTLIGVGIGGLPLIEYYINLCRTKGFSRLSPFFIPAVISNMASGYITIRYGLRGPNFSVTSACASGAHAIGESAKYIQDGHCDVMIAGGCESVITPLAISGFNSMKALSTRNSNPREASRPFDRDRDGFVLSEGAGVLILEDFEKARRRGAKIYGELRGYGFSSDAHHITNPSPKGEGGTLAMKLALRDGELNPEEITYINAHGTSTPVGDSIETMAIKNVFGEHSKNLWISSTKSMTGHSLGAAGAMESVYCLLAMKHKVAPPTINLENPSDDCDLDYIPLVAREGPINHVLNNSFGFGGTNATLIFSKVEE